MIFIIQAAVTLMIVTVTTLAAGQLSGTLARAKESRASAREASYRQRDMAIAESRPRNTQGRAQAATYLDYTPQEIEAFGVGETDRLIAEIQAQLNRAAWDALPPLPPRAPSGPVEKDRDLVKQWETLRPESGEVLAEVRAFGSNEVIRAVVAEGYFVTAHRIDAGHIGSDRIDIHSMEPF